MTQAKKLLEFGEKIIRLCHNSGIEPVLYGSYMVEYYSKIDLDINDLDFYIKEGELKRLKKIFDENGIISNSDSIRKWHTMSVLDGKSKIEFDSIDYWFNGKVETIEIDFNGLKVKALSLFSLKKIYKKASETSEDNPKGNLKKFEILNKI